MDSLCDVFVMKITAILLLAIYTGLAGWMYTRANMRFGHHAKLPMQWGFNKQPNWYAPRRLALTVTPLLSGIGFIAAALSIAWMPGPMDVDGNQAALVLWGLGAFGLAVYAGYLWLVERWDRHAPDVAEKDA
ncbi:hypothetical protein D3C80_1587270 [compost metagenome]|jgi:hypothetical protein